MKVSVVTVSFNSASVIEGCIKSVISQRGVDLEYIVIDGGSTDGTVEILSNFKDHIRVLISEPDRGVYDAMNKGLAQATGDIIGFLNSDDVYADPDALASLVAALEAAKSDCVFADIEFVDDKGKLSRIFTGRSFHPNKFERGVMVAHPSFYARTELVRSVGGFRATFKICGDFELMIKLLRQKGATWTYLPRTVVRMRLGGASTQGLKSYFVNSRELIEACRNCGLRPSLPAIYGRAVWKSLELVSGRVQRLLGTEPSPASPDSWAWRVLRRILLLSRR